MSSYGDPSLETTILNSTNTYRLQHNASTVTWNSTLADFAQAYAQTCKWEHSDSPYGENLAAGYSSPGRAIDGWYRESSMYSYRQSSFSEQTGHFTQLVWQRTDAVGCGAARCNNNDIKGWFLVCEYYPPGNVIGAFAGNV
ncbi:PR-1-like protein, partial [Dissoconium aciculare CBS 342.82]|uniref:PR-1-like protein n=1 Tax=Dissoconium aciculare CBS 342.82 TaxID=1314786 RepID=A0A6J3M956_9PEZI